MNRLAQVVKSSAKYTIKHIGLYEYYLKMRRFLFRSTKPMRLFLYRNVKRFTATISDVTVQFSTEDEYSKSWFFPRYAGGRIHERAVTEMLVEAVQSAKCFVDVGVHLGWYTCIAAKHMPSGTVYGFEMDDLNFDLLQRNIAINKCTNISVYNMAVSDSPGMVSYQRYTKRPNPGFRLLGNAKDEKSAGCVSVKSVILDEFLKSKGVVPDVIKVDVEGAEMKVLRGMSRTLRIIKPILFLEIHPKKLHFFDTSTSAILSLLIENGYTVFEIESMRSQRPKGRPKPLLQDSVIEEDVMLYATAAG